MRLLITRRMPDAVLTAARARFLDEIKAEIDAR